MLPARQPLRFLADLCLTGKAFWRPRHVRASLRRLPPTPSADRFRSSRLYLTWQHESHCILIAFLRDERPPACLSLTPIYQRLRLLIEAHRERCTWRLARRRLKLYSRLFRSWWRKPMRRFADGASWLYRETYWFLISIYFIDCCHFMGPNSSITWVSGLYIYWPARSLAALSDTDLFHCAPSLPVCWLLLYSRPSSWVATSWPAKRLYQCTSLSLLKTHFSLSPRWFLRPSMKKAYHDEGFFPPQAATSLLQKSLICTAGTSPPTQDAQWLRVRCSNI